MIIFGWSIASGDINKDGSTDLAIGVPREDIEITDSNGNILETKTDAGAVNVINGLRDYGLTAVRNQTRFQGMEINL
jgi:hypothetical protein